MVRNRRRRRRGCGGVAARRGLPLGPRVVPRSRRCACAGPGNDAPDSRIPGAATADVGSTAVRSRGPGRRSSGSGLWRASGDRRRRARARRPSADQRGGLRGTRGAVRGEPSGRGLDRRERRALAGARSARVHPRLLPRCDRPVGRLLHGVAALLAVFAFGVSPSRWQALSSRTVWILIGGISVAEFLVRKSWFRHYPHGGPFERFWSTLFPPEKTSRGRRSMESIRCWRERQLDGD